MRDRKPLTSFPDSKALPLEPSTRHFLNLQLPNANESTATQPEFQQAARRPTAQAVDQMQGSRSVNQNVVGIRQDDKTVRC